MSSTQAKAAATRACNLEAEKEAAKKLIAETQGGRPAKRKALEEQIWKPKRKAVESTDTNKGKVKQSSKAGKVAKKADSLSKQPAAKATKASKPLPKSKNKLYRAPTFDSDEGSDPHPVYAISDDNENKEEVDDLPARKKLKSRPGGEESDCEAEDESVENEDEEGEYGDDEEGDDQEGNDEDGDGDDDDAEFNEEVFQLEKPKILGRSHRKPSQIDVDEEMDDDDGGKQVVNIFDLDEEDIDMASHPSRAGTVPLTTTASEGDSESEISESDKPPRPQKSQLKKSTTTKPTSKLKSRARDAVFASERPKIKKGKHIQSHKKTGLSSSAVAAIEGPNWPVWARLVPHPDGKPGVLLLGQHALIKKVVNQAIEHVTSDMVLVRAWPEVATRIQYGTSTLLTIGNSLVVQYPQVSNISDRIQADSDFAKVLLDLAVDRLPVLRNTAPKSAQSQLSFFKLGLGEECQDKVKNLFNKHTYIFPGEWGGDRGLTWIPNAREPFLSPPILETLRLAYFAHETSLGFKFKEQFKVTDANNMSRYEISVPLLALSATAVYHSLYEYQHGEHNKVNFHGNIFIKTYDSHVRTLERLEKERPTRYHDILTRVYLSVVKQDANHNASNEEDAYGIIDLGSD